jgi:hypothetical protein
MDPQRVADLEQEERDRMIKRRRWIQPEFFTSEDVLALPRDARLTFIGLWLYADDYGRQRTHAALIKADVWPVDDDITADTVVEPLVLLAERGMIRIYAADGREYFQLTGWDRHQPVQNPSRSNIPAPPATSARHEPDSDPETPYVGPTETPRSEGESEERVSVRDESEGASEGASEDDEGRPTTHPQQPADRPSVRPPSPFCSAHPKGTSRSCRACGTARLAFRAWQINQEYDEMEPAC